jgi:hypothetical protein
MSSEKDTQDKWDYMLEQMAYKTKQNNGQGDHGRGLRLYRWDARSKHKSKKPPSTFEIEIFYWLI